MDTMPRKNSHVIILQILKCRHNYRDGGVTIEDNRRVQIGVVLPSSLNPEQYKQLVDGGSNNE